MVQTFTGDVVAALLSSSAYTALFYPIHRVKVLLQTQDGNPNIQSGKVVRYTFSTSFPRIVRESGWHSLWRGCLPYMLRHVPSTTLSFAFKDGLQRAMPAYDPATQQAQYTASRLLAGGGAGVLALAVVYPLDLTTIRMAAHAGGHNPGMLETMQGTTQRGGISGLYRGFGVSALAIGSYKALYFGLYDVCKAYLLQPEEHQQLARAVQEGSGAAGGSQHPPAVPSPGSQGLRHLLYAWAVASGVVYVASTATYPVDVVRKRWVVDAGLPVRKYTSAWNCLTTILAKEGIRGLYRFYGYDMVLRFGGGFLLVAYDEVRGGLRNLAAPGGGASAATTAAAGAQKDL